MIACPNCDFKIELTGARPGTFHPKCPRCHQKFELTVFGDENKPPMVRKVVAAAANAPSDGSSVAARSQGSAPAGSRIVPPAATAPQRARGAGSDASITAAPTSHSDTRSVAAAQPPSRVAPGASSRVAATSIPASATAAPAHAHPHSPSPLPPSPAGGKNRSLPHVPEVAPEPALPEPEDLSSGTHLGGYTVLQKLGAGGMGAVYLARQNSLDRNVALKTLHPRLADDPQLVARFTREAFAAAQLTHHNIVQIYDIGQEQGTNFFSMEYVQGRTLSDVLKETHKVDADTGVGYVLQAARGLKFAHEHGLIHRDIKPENLLLNDQGVVKVADLGLVKRVGIAETNLTAAGVAGQGKSDIAVTGFQRSMGTPLYMPPEQATDAANVDQRADIYSLGCTLYHLVTGQPPFTGRTALEVMTQHASAPVTPPDAVVGDVPHNLSPLIVKMLAKQPAGRYPSMKDVIDALEQFMGIATVGPYMPSLAQIKAVENAAADFNRNAWTTLRPKVVLAFYALCALMTFALAWANRGSPLVATNLAGGMVGLALMTTIAYHVISGLLQKSLVFTRLRQLVFGAGLRDWIGWAGGLMCFGFVVYAFGLWLPWLIAAAGGVTVALGFYFTFDVLAARAREPALRSADHVIKMMRARGVDESAIRNVICRFAGRHWEAFFESLFGYEDKLQARTAWGKERGRDRPKFAAWREPVIAYIDHRLDARRAAREAKLLAKVEQKAMQAAGVDERLAQKRAAKQARQLVAGAAKMKGDSSRHVAQTLAPPPPGRPITAPPGPSAHYAALVSAAAADVDPDDKHDAQWSKFARRRFGTPVDVITGPFWRAVVGLVLLAIFAQWWTSTSTRNVISAGNQVLATKREEADAVARSKQAVVAAIDSPASLDTLGRSAPLTIPLVPAAYTREIRPPTFFVAGLLLFVGALFRGHLLGILMWLTAGIALFGASLSAPGMSGHVAASALVAAVLWVLTVIFTRSKYE